MFVILVLMKCIKNQLLRYDSNKNFYSKGKLVVNT